MTITPLESTLESIFQFQAEYYRQLADEVLQPLVTNYGRKDWESKYDPKFTKGTSAKSERSVLPLVSSLPTKRWVKPRKPEGSMVEKAEHWDALHQWLLDNKVKHQLCQVSIDGDPAWVYLFKKSKDAMMFKLTWG